MKVQEIKNSIFIHDTLLELNALSPISEEKVLRIKVQSYEGIKLSFHKNNLFLKFLLPFFFVRRRFLPNFFLFNRIKTFRKNRVLSLAEILGRIFYAGFEVIEFDNQGSQYLITFRKVKEPNLNKYNNEGLIIGLERMSSNQKYFSLYKLRTMHPYSEFVQDLLLRKNGFSKSGKIENDIRLTKYGKIIRKYYIDELPQLINVLQGQLKLVGVRAVSTVYYEALPEELKELRKHIKPGCIPPYVADGLKASFENACQSEINYLLKYKERPIRTDIIYFFKTFYNIIFKSIRSQ
jgi:lipopolysaccharide/colanic/teichoic acid biosynthesis glycosyltransferase